MSVGVSYAYYDTAGRKHERMLILAGRLAPQQIDAIYNKCRYANGRYDGFLPTEVGLPSMQDEFDGLLSENPGTPWHYMIYIENTGAEPNYSLDFDEFYAMMMAIGEWDWRKVQRESGLGYDAGPEPLRVERERAADAPVLHPRVWETLATWDVPVAQETPVVEPVDVPEMALADLQALVLRARPIIAPVHNVNITIRLPEAVGEEHNRDP